MADLVFTIVNFVVTVGIAVLVLKMLIDKKDEQFMNIIKKFREKQNTLQNE